MVYKDFYVDLSFSDLQNNHRNISITDNILPHFYRWKTQAEKYRAQKSHVWKGGAERDSDAWFLNTQLMVDANI